MNTEFLRVAQKIAREVTHRPKYGRTPGDIEVEISRKMPNLRAKMEQLRDEIISAGYDPEAAQVAVFGGEISPIRNKTGYRQVFQIQKDVPELQDDFLLNILRRIRK